MSKPRLPEEKIKTIIQLRKNGHSYNEIKKITRCGYGTIFRYCKNVSLSKKSKEKIDSKQGGSKERSKRNWEKSKKEAKKLLGDLNFKNKLYLLAGIYWGEGTKKELNIMNGDPNLLKVFLSCIKDLGVLEKDIIISLRIFGSEKKTTSINYWSKGLGIKKELIKIGEVVPGSDSNKLPNGMCRIRVKKGGRYFKLIMSMIQYITEVIK